MKNKLFAVSAFAIVALIQLYVPANMIFEREDILATGKEYKFETEPVDPNDPLRGKYIYLRFKESTYPLKDRKEWERDEQIFVLLRDSLGFAKVAGVSKEKPANGVDYLEAKVEWPSYYGDPKVFIAYPFDRFYMEESKAYDAELSYRESSDENGSRAYALVNIKNGESVLKDVIIEDMPIKEFVKRRLEKGKKKGK
jgi:uncharacterized membrane-anchored protein